VDLGAQAPVHNGIEIQTPLQELFVRVAIDVSADAKDWRVLQEGAPIFRFAKNGLDGNQLVRYTDNTSRYLRLRITDGPDGFPLAGVRVWHEVRQEAELTSVDLKLRPDPAAPAGESWWIGDAGPAGELLSQVMFSVKQAAFHRPVRIRTSDDGTTWRTTGSGDIHRMESADGVREQLRVGFAETRAHFLRVEVVNRNDTPLADAALSLYATPRHVVLVRSRAAATGCSATHGRRPRSTDGSGDTMAALEAAAAPGCGSRERHVRRSAPGPTATRCAVGGVGDGVAALGLLRAQVLGRKGRLRISSGNFEGTPVTTATGPTIAYQALIPYEGEVHRFRRHGTRLESSLMFRRKFTITARPLPRPRPSRILTFGVVG
jgi:hypothetical protein